MEPIGPATQNLERVMNGLTDNRVETQSRLEKVAYHFREALTHAGANMEFADMLDTPMRYAKFLDQFLRYPQPTWTQFEPSQVPDQMILVRDIQFYSLCEHHTLPFFGHGHIAYIPTKKIVGISKLARTLRYIAQRFQTQERITQDVANLLQEKLEAKGVGVQLSAQHLCMSMRGVESHEAKTVTTALTGIFKDAEVKSEFLSQIK